MKGAERTMLFGVLWLVAAVLLTECTILLLRSRARSRAQIRKLLVELSRELDVSGRLAWIDLYRRREVLYANKRSLERQMSCALDEGARKAYQTVLDRIARSILALEERLPRLELLRQRMTIHGVLVLGCALVFGLASWAYLIHGGGWS